MEVLVSIVMLTYNHEQYICQAIEGVLLQKTNFAFELIIGEDCSTDNTAKIVREYAAENPNRIRARCNSLNKGMSKNAIMTLSECNGKYIALCEGDDYWTDPYKLQKQVDFLEANEEYSICFHPVKVWKENGKTMVDDLLTREVPETTTILDLAESNYIHTPSVIFRRNQEVFDTFISLGAMPVGDYVLHMLNAKYGKIKKLLEVMAVYRVHEGGIWSSKTEIQKEKEAFRLVYTIYKNIQHPIRFKLKEACKNMFLNLYKSDGISWSDKRKYFMLNPISLHTYFIMLGFSYKHLMILIKFKSNIIRYKRFIKF